MLHLTDQAAGMIHDLIDHADLPEGAGLRIAQREDRDCLAMSLAPAPDPDDAVVVEYDAAVFLAPLAQRRLDRQTLDARSGATGSAFFLRP